MKDPAEISVDVYIIKEDPSSLIFTYEDYDYIFKTDNHNDLKEYLLW